MMIDCDHIILCVPVSVTFLPVSNHLGAIFWGLFGIMFGIKVGISATTKKDRGDHGRSLLFQVPTRFSSKYITFKKVNGQIVLHEPHNNNNIINY